MTTTKKAPSKRTAPRKAPAKSAPAETQATTDPTPTPDPDPDAEALVAAVDEAPVADKPVAPAAATIEPPAIADEQPTAAPLPSSADASAERLRTTQAHLTITDADGGPVDPDTLFRPAGAPGLVVCQVRLLEHITATMHNRPMTRLLLAKGRGLTKQSAQIILDRIRQGQAAE